MGQLCDRYFPPEKSGKAYKSEKEYMDDMMNYVDMSIMSLYCVMFPNSTVEDKGERAHVAKFSGGKEEAFKAVFRQVEDFDPSIVEISRAEGARARAFIQKRLVFTEYKGGHFRFIKLVNKLELSELEIFILCLGLAAAQDEKYRLIFADLQSGKESDIPSLQTAAFLYSLIGSEPDSAVLGHLMQKEGFFINSLLDTRQGEDGNALSLRFAANKRLLGHLLGYDDIDSDIKAYARYFPPEDVGGKFLVRRQFRDEVGAAFALLLADGKKTEDASKADILHIYGPAGNGRTLSVRNAAFKQDMGVIKVDMQQVELMNLPDIEGLVKKLAEEAFLLNSLILVEDKADREEQETENGRVLSFISEKLKNFLKNLALYTDRFAWISIEKSPFLSGYGDRIICFNNPLFTAGERVVVWEKLKKAYPVSKDIDWALCANKYILSAKAVENTLETAKILSEVAGKKKIEMPHIREAVSQLTPNQLGRYATRIPAVYTWDDLVIGEDQKHQMMLICNQLKYRNIVGEEWGFFKKTAYGRGICALFYGTPGTGKTMAVQVMANELGLDLYRVDLSQMVSKYIGETEKNISELFKKARNINALLFFDEADSMFAKRSEVKDSHDRNANAETAHLLQKLEDYDGITILATNYINNIDDAFKRRIKFVVNFSSPDAAVRLKLWNTIIPKGLVCEEELDFEFFADNFELSGSAIKEILTNSAFIAAGKGEKLANRHIVEAVKVNYAKYGKLLSDDAFGYLADCGN